jgi:hypothetical protein
MDPLLHITAMRYLGDYRLALTFSDGVECEVDLKAFLNGEVFEPLKDARRFAQVYLDEEMRTIAWRNGADFAPTFLYEIGELVASA